MTKAIVYTLILLAVVFGVYLGARAMFGAETSIHHAALVMGRG